MKRGRIKGYNAHYCGWARVSAETGLSARAHLSRGISSAETLSLGRAVG
jgi:hypothetical protein